jgi:hypothetical protein
VQVGVVPEAERLEPGVAGIVDGLGRRHHRAIIAGARPRS